MNAGEFIQLKDERDENNNLVKTRAMFFLPLENGSGLGIKENTTYDEHGTPVFWQSIPFSDKKLEEVTQENGEIIYLLVEGDPVQLKSKSKSSKEKKEVTPAAKETKKKLK